MLKLIVGVKGTGKTKTLIEMVNSALDTSKGSVICIEKGTKLIHEVKYQARLVDTDEYCINDATSLFGFLGGIYASNHDVTHIFVDAALKICNNDMASFIKFVKDADKLCEKHDISLVMTASIPVEQIDDELKQYI